MISIVVCSINDDLLKQLKKNITETIGTDCEVLAWENKGSNLGICQVYNQVAAKASFPFILFLHEDVTFNTMNWGRNLLHYFETDEKIGLAGIAGSRYKARMISGWYTGEKEIDVYNVIHKDGDKIEVINNVTNHVAEQVVCIDGVFMMCRKEVWKGIRFQDKLLSGFHFYDIDFSLRVSEQWKVVVVPNVELVHHTTGGDFGDKWVEQAFIYHESESARLPLSIGSIPDNMEMIVAKCWLDWLKGKNISFLNRVRWIGVQRLYAYSFLWYSIIKFLIYRPFGLAHIHKLIKGK